MTAGAVMQAPTRGHRIGPRTRILARAFAARVSLGLRRPPKAVRRILIAHHLLLGDTLMLTPLLAKLREKHPAAEIAMTLPEAFAPLYAGAPYGLRPLPWNPRRPLPAQLFDPRGYDLALVPGDNRYATLAMAMGARWIVAFAGDRPRHKSWAVDEARPYPEAPAAWGDMVAGLIDGPPPAPFRKEDWPAPPARPFDLPAAPYALLHLGASSPLKLWPAERWRALALGLVARGVKPVWSTGPGEADLIAATDPQALYPRFAGTLDLAQVWRLIANARILVCPDTGIAHLGRIVGTPTVTLFGPGSPLLCGAGDFWRSAAYRAIGVDPFPCRDQRILFKREIAWVRRCARGLKECPLPRCMQAIELQAVLDAIDLLIHKT
jgi:ADP-heptose:LPS heptosyltransferase